jgi:ketosteroid isomerase-like protein
MMMRFLTILLSLTAAASAQRSPAEAEIRAARERSNRALASRDLTAMAAALTPDFVQVRGSGAFTPSREAYLESLARSFADAHSVTYRRTPERVEVSEAAPLAAEHGHWVGLRPDGSPAYGGTYLAMWRKTAAGWKIRSELFVWLSCQDAAACAEYRKTMPPAPE